ncbi:hypothetical protein DRO34_03880 [Candidatus Bathyarchaeota archaeon]|nr:MAG: hypothetical protein DRO34_03880 [Candidatus Bathyarchaeota archaeon]
MSEEGKTSLKKLAPRILKAALWSLMTGVVFFLIERFLALFLFELYPKAQNLFTIFAWTIIISVFLVKFSEGTIFKYAFLVGRNFFLMLFFIYSTNCGVLTVEAAGFLQASNLRIELEFVPLVVLIVFSSLVSIVRNLVQAIDFLTETSV